MEYKDLVLSDTTFGKRFYIPQDVEVVQEYKGHVEGLEAVAWMPGGNFASASVDGEIIVWNAPEKGQRPSRKKTLGDGNTGLYCMAPSADGNYVVQGVAG